MIEASLMAQQVKNPPAVQETEETWVPSLGLEDPLEKEMATHLIILDPDLLPLQVEDVTTC